MVVIERAGDQPDIVATFVARTRARKEYVPAPASAVKAVLMPFSDAHAVHVPPGLRI